MELKDKNIGSSTEETDPFADPNMRFNESQYDMIKRQIEMLIERLERIIKIANEEGYPPAVEQGEPLLNGFRHLLSDFSMEVVPREFRDRMNGLSRRMNKFQESLPTGF